MKSDKWKHIIIKNSKLRHIRKNLRTIIKLAINKELKRLSSLRDLYSNRGYSNLTPSQRKRKRMLSRLGTDLLNARQDSVLFCSMATGCMSRQKDLSMKSLNCLNLDLDKVWDPLDKFWICVKCYNYYFGTDELKKAYEYYIFKQKLIDEKDYW